MKEQKELNQSSDHLKKTRNKRTYNEKGLMFVCLSCQDMNSDTMFLLMRGVNMSFCT